MIRRIHHLDIIVRDLAAAASRYGLSLGQPAPEPETLAEPGEGMLMVSGAADDVGDASARLAKRNVFSRDHALRQGLRNEGVIG